jgi:hypothetical protein
MMPNLHSSRDKHLLRPKILRAHSTGFERFLMLRGIYVLVFRKGNRYKIYIGSDTKCRAA